MSSQAKAYLYALLAIFLWSSVATAFKLTLKYISPIELLFYSSFFSLIFFAIVLNKRLISTLKLLNNKRLILMGIINPFLYYLMLFKAYDLLKAQEAQIINYTWGILIPIFSAIFFKERLRAKDFISGVICYFAVFIIITKGSLNFEINSLEGVVFAVLSTIFWAFYWVLSRNIKIDSTQILFLNFLVGTLAILIYFIFTQGSFNIPKEGLLGTIYIALFEMGVSFLLWSKALKLTRNSALISYLIYLSPILSLIFIYIILKEQIYTSTIIALILIFFALLYQRKE